jgi:hypothetical protein
MMNEKTKQLSTDELTGYEEAEAEELLMDDAHTGVKDIDDDEWQGATS